MENDGCGGVCIRCFYFKININVKVKSQSQRVTFCWIIPRSMVYMFNFTLKTITWSSFFSLRQMSYIKLFRIRIQDHRYFHPSIYQCGIRSDKFLNAGAMNNKTIFIRFVISKRNLKMFFDDCLYSSEIISGTLSRI